MYDALGVLGVLGLPESLIEEVRGMLSTAADDLEGAEPGTIGDVFGGSEAGGQLSHHAAIARRHVAEAVLQMAAGLRGYSTELAQHAERVTTTDVQAGVDLTRINGATACVAPASFQNNNACQLPTSSAQTLPTITRADDR